MYLAEALTNYCQRNKGQITFQPGYSLNKLALAMWEYSEFCGIDAGILSKVLSGKRLFTPRQLSVFCKVLAMEDRDREYLFYCLHRDQCLKSGTELGIPFIFSAGTHLFIEALMRQAEDLSMEGKCKDLYNLSGLIESYLHDHVLTMYRHNREGPIITTYQRALCFRAKSMVGIALQDTVMQETRAIVQSLRKYQGDVLARVLSGYAASYAASAYRVLGIFPSRRNAAFDRKSAIMSRRCALKALAVLPYDDNEYIASLRNVMDSSISLEERDVFLEYLKVAQRIAPMQPAPNFLSTMQLAGTVGRGMAVFRMGDPFALKARMEKYFNRTLAGTKLYELSGLKTELEIHVALGSAKDSYLERSIERALTLADEESKRYRDIIVQLAGQLK